MRSTAAWLPWCFGALLAVGCQPQRIAAHTDRRAYVLDPGDSIGLVRLSVRNRSARPVYVQTADGQADILLMIRVDARGGTIVGADTTGPEIWSLFFFWKPGQVPATGMVGLAPDSVLTSVYRLPRGHYRMLVRFGDTQGKVDEHGVWLERFSIR